MNTLDNKSIRWNSYILLSLLLFTLFSGVVRKWVTTNSTITLGTTVLQIIIIYLLLFMRRRHGMLIAQKFHSILILYFLYSCALAATPAIPTFYHGITGIVVHSGFWIGLLIYLSNRNAFPTSRFKIFILILCIAEAALAIIQYQLPYDHFLNIHAQDQFYDGADEEPGRSITVVGDAIRIAGTFSYIGGFGAFVLFFQLFIFALVVERKINWVGFMLLAGLGQTLAFMSGYRAVVFIYAASLLTFLFTGIKSSRKKESILIVLAGLFLVWILDLGMGNTFTSSVGNFVDSASENFFYRLNNEEEEGVGRILEPFRYIFNNSFPNSLTGNGLGITYQGVSRLFGTSEIYNLYPVENEIGKTLLEGGYILLGFKLAFIFLLIKNLALPRIYSAVILMLVFFYASLSGSTYNSTFVLLGLIYLDAAFYKQKQYADIN